MIFVIQFFESWKVEIFEPAISSMNISQFQCWLKTYTFHIFRNRDGFEEVEVIVYDYFMNHRKIALRYSYKLPTNFPIEAQLISDFRAAKSKEGYAAIGGGSLLHQITDEQFFKTKKKYLLQAQALKTALEAKNMVANIYVGMRYWYPFTEEAIQQKDRITRLVVLPLYPQYSISTTRSSICVLHSLFSEYAYLSRLHVAIIKSWYQRECYIKSMADLIAKELGSFSNPSKMGFTHGVPLSYVEDAGDPYKDQMEECISLIMRELKARGIDNEHTLTSISLTALPNFRTCSFLYGSFIFFLFQLVDMLSEL
ncbi:hypothetical protein UlMin_001447 [Ulmus minor]